MKNTTNKFSENNRRDLVTMLFDNALNQVERDEVNNYLYSKYPNLEKKLFMVHPDTKLDYEVGELAYELSYTLEDSHILNEILEMLVLAYPRELFRHTSTINDDRRFYLNSIKPILITKEGEQCSNDLVSESKIKLDRFKDLKPTYNSFINGDFEEKFNNSDVIKSDKGIFHEVVLLNAGQVLARGSNISGQLDFKGSNKKYKDVVCGRYFTALLTEEGTVEIFGLSLDCFMNNHPYKVGTIINQFFIAYDESPDFKKNEFRKVIINHADQNSKMFSTITNNQTIFSTEEGAEIFRLDEIGDSQAVYALTFFKAYAMYRQFIESKYWFKFIPHYVSNKIGEYEFATIDELKNIISIDKEMDALYATDKDGNKYILLDEEKFLNTYHEFDEENIEEL